MQSDFWKRILAVGIGGFFGGAVRQAIELLMKDQFPAGTVVINLSGTFISAFLVVILAKKSRFPQWLADFMMVGVLGAYTTYSTAILDLVKSAPVVAVIYWMISIVGGVLVVILARWLARKLVA